MQQTFTVIGRLPYFTFWVKLLFLACFIVLLPRTSLADVEGGLSPYTMVSPDHEYIFVMLMEGDRKNPRPYIFDKYSLSGLYRNDGSTTPLWTVDWAGDVILPSGPTYLIRKGGWARQDDGYGVEAIAFLANGRVLKTYRVCDLVDFPWLLPHSASHYQWQKTLSLEEGAHISRVHFVQAGAVDRNDGVLLSEQLHTLQLETLQGDSYVFDITTGDIIESHRSMRIVLAFIAIFAIPLYGLYLFRRSKKPQTPLFKTPQRVTIISTLLIFLISSVVVGVHQLTSQSSDHPLFIALWRFLIYLPVRVAEKLGLETIDVFFWLALSIVFWFLFIVGLIILNHRIVWALARISGRKRE
jgi:hypothetical protein